MTTYQEAMEFLLNRTNFEQKQSTTFRHTDFKLDRMRLLLEELGNPQSLPSIHIAGTKGKGSTAHMVAACLQSAGHRVGLFTSPHLESYEERIQIDGIPITHQQLIEQTDILKVAVDRIRSLSESNELTFFELTTALAWLCFREANVEIAVMEVGLGGRLDSTNICHPLVTVITSIGIDHTQQLGDTITQIASEKAGIIKPRVPVVSGCRLPDAQVVIREKSQQLDCSLTEVDSQITYSVSDSSNGLTNCSINVQNRCFTNLTLPLSGEHQVRNLATALGAIEAIKNNLFPVSDAAIQSAIHDLQIPGRQEVINLQPKILLDVAHNTDSTQALIETLKKETVKPDGLRVLVFGSARDKPFVEQLTDLMPYFDHFILTTAMTSQRCCPPEEIRDSATSLATIPISIAQTPIEAINQARVIAEESGMIVVSGSFYLAGEIRPYVREWQEKRQPHSHVIA